ncbi:RICIN domain-containing protein [Kitasatospora sp. RB6PN24]|uniref:RICIN domain-containing protein n=1 Tax=Kitasatospora humi TaxID=2893891 RepID=UPI001E423E2E|nr:RICIN domain-containing protein [Kitasatospora humi]MCC9308327.1 RICIN domain-containing protein [Kitasatospora humi]
MKSSTSPKRHRAIRLMAISGIAILAPLAGTVSAHAAGTSTHVTFAGQFALYNDTTGKCADLPNYGSNPVNTPVTQYNCTLGPGDNQMWDWEATRSVNGVQLYELVNDKSGLCMDLPNYGSVPAGTRVSTYTCNYSYPYNDNQEFYRIWVNSTETEVVNLASGLCLDVSGWASDGSDMANNLPLTMYPCYNASWANGGYDDHLWSLVN